MPGKLYGVGVGPGDPELLTLKALKVIKEADVIAVPGTDAKMSAAYKIAAGAYPEIEQKELLAVPMPMTKEAAVLEENHAKGAETLCRILESGKTAAFLTLGDATVYSTYLYLHRKVLEMGCEAQIISGIPSFCAVSARLNTGLVEKDEELHVIPASYQIEDALKLPGTKVLMKAGKKMKDVKAVLKETGALAVMVENCGMADEKIYIGAENIPEDAGYYSLIIVKDKQEKI